MSIVLRDTTEGDLAYVLSAEHDKDNGRFVTVWLEDQHRAALSDENSAHMIIEDESDRRVMGFVILSGLQNSHRSVEFMRIVVTDKGKGYGRAAVGAIKRYAFDTLSAHRLWLDVKEHNTRARAIYEKEGFRYEGTLRECLKGPTGFESLVVMSMLEQEFRDARQ